MQTIDISCVTSAEIDRCHRFIDLQSYLPYYLVESEQDSLIEYKVSSIYRNDEWSYTCTCKAGKYGFIHCKNGYCKHVRWAKAAEEDYKELVKAQAFAEARIELAEERRRKAAMQELHIGYTNVDTETLERIAERNKKPAKSNHPCIQARPFSLLK